MLNWNHFSFPRNSPEFFCPSVGHGVGGLRHDNRGLLHRQPRRLPRPRQATDITHWHQWPKGERGSVTVLYIFIYLCKLIGKYVKAKVGGNVIAVISKQGQLLHVNLTWTVLGVNFLFQMKEAGLSTRNLPVDKSRYMTKAEGYMLRRVRYNFNLKVLR